MKILYVLSMALAFSMEIDSISVPYFLKYIIAFIWIIIGAFYDHVEGRFFTLRITKIKKDLFKLFLIPIAVAFSYTCVIWIAGQSGHITFSNFTRLISNLGCMAIIAASAIMCTTIFGKDVIRLTFAALVFTIGFNALVVIQNYGLSPMITYITHVFQADSYEYGSTLSRVSYAMEIHDGTFAMGIFLLYFVFYEEAEMKTRLLQIVMALLCSYLGFKRNEQIGILVVSVIAITVVRKKGKDFLRTNQIVTFAVLIACFSFVLAVKYLDQMTLLLSVLDIYRIRVYRFIREIYSVSPFYIGKGYSYVNYILGNQNKLLGTSHSDLVRVYTEMGFWGFVAWIWYYFTYIPRYIYRNYSELAGKMFMMFSFYVFSTYFLDNTLTLFANQFVYYVVPIAILYDEYGRNTQLEQEI